MKMTVCSIVLLVGSSSAFAGFNAQMISASNYDPDTSVMNASLGITGSHVLENFEDYSFETDLTILVEGVPFAQLACDAGVADEKWDGDCVLHNVNAVPMDGRDVSFQFSQGVLEFGVGISHLEQATRVLVNGVQIVSDVRTMSNWTSGGPNVRNGYLWITADSGDVIESVTFDGNDMSDSVFFDHAAWLCADDSGLVHHWNLEGHTDDIVGGAIGTPNALSYCTDYLPGNVGLGGVFNGSNSRIETNLIPMLGPDDSITFSVWFNCDDMPATIAGDLYGLETGGAQEIRLLVRGDNGGLQASFRDDNGVQGVAMYPNSVIDGQWHHAAAVRDGVENTVDLYLDGVLVASTSSSTGSINVSSPVTMFIGADHHSSNGAQDYFPGMIDELRVYNRALTAAEIRALAAAPCLPGDINEDGVVNVDDLNIMLSNWALTCFP